LCTEDEAALVRRFFDAMDETKSGWIAFVRARAFGDEPEKEARDRLKAFRDGFDCVRFS
jgi:hypothetical protein